jgi:NADPH:quinone reductase-like Zn-dependent oxidoreductase
LLVNQNYQYKLFESPRPQLDPHEILIRTKAIGLNPIDWKTVEYKFCMPSLPWINGRECAGVIEAVGAEVTSLRIGQRVWASTCCRDRRAGCFQELSVALEHTLLILPASSSFEEAACLGVADQFAVQLAAEMGLEVIAVASQRMKQRLLDLGAHCVVARDGRSLADIAAEVQQIGRDNILYGIDLVGPQSAIFGVGCLSRQRAAKFAPLAVPAPSIDVPMNVEIVNVEMKRFVLDPTSRKYAVHLTELVAMGRVAVLERVVLTGGLAAVEEGLLRLRNGDTGGKKLVIRM